MLYNNNTYQSQKKLVDWVRTGLNPEVPGTVKEGLNQYRRLFRNNIANSLQQAFPITFEILSKQQWDILVDDFFANHDAKTPQIWKLPYEFFQFVEKQNYSLKFNLPFLDDLLHFEWIEIEVHTMADIFPEPYIKNGDLLNDKIEVNNENRLINLKYPVHLFAAKESLNNVGDYYLLTYRMPKTFEVKFMNLPPLHTLFFEKISIQQMTATEIINEIIAENPAIDKIQLTHNITDFINKMMSEKVFLGYCETYLN